MQIIENIWKFLVEWGVSWAEYRRNQRSQFNNYF